MVEYKCIQQIFTLIFDKFEHTKVYSSFTLMLLLLRSELNKRDHILLMLVRSDFRLNELLERSKVDDLEVRFS